MFRTLLAVFIALVSATIGYTIREVNDVDGSSWLESGANAGGSGR